MGSPDPPGFGTLSIAKKFGSMQRLFQRLSSGGHTRSHPEHGSQAPDRRWYLVLGSGRVGRRWIHAPREVNLAGGFFLLVTPDLFRGRPTQNPSQKRFPSQKCHSLQIRSRPRLSSRPLCRDRLTRYPIADTFPLAETLLITDTVPIADTISLAFLTPETYNLFFTSY